MTRRAIIVSHGQPSDPDPAEARLADFAFRVSRLLPGWHVGSATLARSGALDDALRAAGPHPLIYPMFMTAGWFTRDALLDRLDARHGHVLPPLGLDPGLPGMAANLLRGHIAQQGWCPTETRLFLAAHGSGRSPNPARDTRAFATALARLIPLAGMHVGFVEQAPFLAEAATGLGPRSICLPFFAAPGGHVTDDIPAALDKAGFTGLRLDPIARAAGTPVLVAQALRKARARPEAAA